MSWEECDVPGSRSSDEKLGTIGVSSSIGHREKTLLAVLNLEVLIWELGSINYEIDQFLPFPPRSAIRTRLSASAITLGEVTSLNHEVLDDTVKGRALVSKSLLSSSQSPEVLHSLGNSLSVQAHHDGAHGLIAMADLEEDLVGNLGALDSFGGLGEEQEGDGQDQQS